MVSGFSEVPEGVAVEDSIQQMTKSRGGKVTKIVKNGMKLILGWAL